MKYYSVITLLLITTTLFAQPAKQAPNLPDFDNKRLNAGFKLGINTMDYRIIHAKNLEPGVQRRFAEVITLNPGINVGMVSNLRLNKYFSLRALPGFSFGQRDLLFIRDDGVDDKYTKNPLELKSTYIELPIIIKFNGARMMNAKPYLVGGINLRYDLAKSKKDGLMIKPFDIYWELGAGIDSYMSYFRFSTEFKVSVGMFNILNPKGTGEYEDIYYTKVLDKLFSRIFVINFYFE
jgi:hypothetical protein